MSDPWRDPRIYKMHTFPDETQLVVCNFCDGTGRHPEAVWYQRHFEQQIQKYKSPVEPCSVCQGKGKVHILPGNDEDPLLPCVFCEGYGRVLKDFVEGEMLPVLGVCQVCHGYGICFHSGKDPRVQKPTEHKPYTGETRRLRESEIP